MVYPKSNQHLFKSVEAEGGIVSEYYIGEQPLQWHFPARNRVIAGLSDAVVVRKAAEKSGALMSARHTMEAELKGYVTRDADGAFVRNAVEGRAR